MFFEKKITIFKKKDKNSWQKIKDSLKNSGLKGIRASHYSVDTLCACGCGSKLDPRNFGAKGFIDRDVYFIDVKQSDLEKAKSILKENGIENLAIVEEDPIGKFGRV